MGNFSAFPEIQDDGQRRFWGREANLNFDLGSESYRFILAIMLFLPA